MSSVRSHKNTKPQREATNIEQCSLATLCLYLDCDPLHTELAIDVDPCHVHLNNKCIYILLTLQKYIQ